MRVMRRALPALTLLAVSTAIEPLGAQNSVRQSPPNLAAAVPGGVATMRAARKDGNVTLDGRLDDPAWQRAEASRNFTQSWPNPGKPGTDPTEVRVV